MKRICKLVAIVAVAALLGILMVACAPSKGMDAAQAAWAQCAKDKLRDASDVDIKAVAFTSFVNNSESDNKNCYYFCIECTVTRGTTTNKATYYYSGIPTSNGGFTCHEGTKASYEGLEKNVNLTVNKTGTLSSGQIKKLVKSYQDNKADWFKAVVTDETVD